MFKIGDRVRVKATGDEGKITFVDGYTEIGAVYEVGMLQGKTHFVECDLELVDEYGDAIKIKDSGNRREFETGSVRDMAEGKGDMVSIPWEAILRLSKHYENGAKKYKRFNYRLGIPVSSFIDSACRHLAKYQCGCDDEDHLSAAAFNVLGAMLMEEIKPEMQDLPLRKGKNTFRYFEEKENGTL